MDARFYIELVFSLITYDNDPAMSRALARHCEGETKRVDKPSSMRAPTRISLLGGSLTLKRSLDLRTVEFPILFVGGVCSEESVHAGGQLPHHSGAHPSVRTRHKRPFFEASLPAS